MKGLCCHGKQVVGEVVITYMCSTAMCTTQCTSWDMYTCQCTCCMWIPPMTTLRWGRHDNCQIFTSHFHSMLEQHTSKRFDEQESVTVANRQMWREQMSFLSSTQQKANYKYYAQVTQQDMGIDRICIITTNNILYCFQNVHSSIGITFIFNYQSTNYFFKNANFC